MFHFYILTYIIYKFVLRGSPKKTSHWNAWEGVSSQCIYFGDTERDMTAVKLVEPICRYVNIVNKSVAWYTNASYRLIMTESTRALESQLCCKLDEILTFTLILTDDFNMSTYWHICNFQICCSANIKLHFDIYLRVVPNCTWKL